MNWETLLNDGDPEARAKVIELVKAAIEVRYEWNVRDKPSEIALIQLVQATREVEEIS